jgi:hypothetical protein
MSGGGAVSDCGDSTLRVWLADGTRLEPSPYLSKQVRGVAAHCNVIGTAARLVIAVPSQRSRDPVLVAVLFPGPGSAGETIG